MVKSTPPLRLGMLTRKGGVVKSEFRCGADEVNSDLGAMLSSRKPLPRTDESPQVDPDFFHYVAPRSLDGPPF